MPSASPTGPNGPFLPTGPPFAAAGDLFSAGPTGATGPAGGTTLAGELRQVPTTTLDRGYEPPQTMNYATFEPDAPVVFSGDAPPSILTGIDAGLAFAVALAALLLARRLRREGVRLLALVLVVGPIVAIVI